MSRLRRSLLLAVAAAAGTATPSNAAPTVALVGLPCTLAGTNAAAAMSGIAGGTALICTPWAEVGQGAAVANPAGIGSCGTVQVNDGVARGPSGGAATTCGAPGGSGPVAYAAGADDTLFVCTYVSTTTGSVRVYDADDDASNGSQCAPVTTSDRTGTSFAQGGVCLAKGQVKPIDDIVPDPDPDPWCAGCLSGFNPVIDDIFESVVEVAFL